ncbi:MAG: OmpA family protein [Opitutales bacterium]|nr:OmpA family protein [Opitutales bacterium]
MKKDQEADIEKTQSEHHGGAWKVAAADFFCSMMALFMVMWILSQDDEMLAQTAHFFNNPYIAMGDREKKSDTPIDLGGSSGIGAAGDDGNSSGEKRDFVEQLAQQFIKHLNIDAQDEESPYSVNTTSDGLMLTVFNRTQKPMFEENSSEFTTWGNLVMRNIAWLIDRYDLKIRIEAHTMPLYEGTEEYGAWELSTEQANAVRRALVYYALDPEKLSRVTAFANTRPLPDTPLDDPAQQRIVISLEPE